MEISKPELHGSGFHALLREADRSLGAETTDRILEALGTTRALINDADAWFSLAFAEALMGRLSTQDPRLIGRAMQHMLSPRGLGMLYPLFRAFGSPMFTYRQVGRLSSRLNKVGTYSVHELGRGRVELVYRGVPGAARESTRHMCEVRRAQLMIAPTLFDLPPAQVEHRECIALGHEHCLYEVRWREPLGRWPRRCGALVGAVAALATLGWPPTWSASIAPGMLGMILAGYATGLAFELRRALASRVDELVEHQDALTLRTEANEQRFAELLEAKAEVDRKVEQRTDELRGASQKLSDALSQLQDLDRAKTDFFNNVSHELRSPLTLILAPLEDMAAGRVPPGGLEAAVGAMQRNAGRLLHLINQLLDLAKIDAGAMTIAPAPVQLVGLLRSIAHGFEPAAAKKGVALRLNAPEVVLNVVLDASWIESAVTNLVANALRMTDRGGSVRIGIEDRGAEVAISVADDGPGIPAEHHKKVFERFAQGDSNRRVVGGTGIGLVLVREAARLHGGDVSLVSDLGRGATFTLRLPRKPAGMASIAPPGTTKPLTLPPRISSEPPPETSEADRSGPAPNAPLALLVEDNPELLHFMADVLSVRYRVRAAANGKEALALAPLIKPDVVVSDVAMDVMDGYQLCRELRAAEETRTLPVLLVTARTDLSSVLAGFEAGANDYVLKPFHGHELLARVDVHVRVRRMVQELALQERHAMLGVLAASVAHQVRNPLTSLVSGLPAMRRRVGAKIDAPSLELMDVMIECAERIERLTQDLLDLSRVDREEGGKYRPSDGLRAALRLFRTRASEGVTIEDDVETSEVIDGRVGDMNHVFMNLLDNALRAIGQRGTVRVFGRMENGFYVARVEDSGPGVDEETARRIFEPFFTTREAGQGTGLGLAIARQVVHAAGGTIEVSRSSLGGAEFTTRIPLASRDVQPPAPPPS
jgi:signal transduction histidine kinase